MKKHGRFNTLLTHLMTGISLWRMREWVAGVVFIYSTKSLICDKFSLFIESNPVFVFVLFFIFGNLMVGGRGGGYKFKMNKLWPYICMWCSIILSCLQIYFTNYSRLDCGTCLYNSVWIRIIFFLLITFIKLNTAVLTCSLAKAIQRVNLFWISFEWLMVSLSWHQHKHFTIYMFSLPTGTWYHLSFCGCNIWKWCSK